MNKLFTLTFLLCALPVFAGAEPEMIATSSLSGNGSAAIQTDLYNFAGGDFIQSAVVTTTQKNGFGSIYSQVDNTSYLNAINVSSWNSVGFYANGEVATVLAGGGDHGPLKVGFNAFGSLDTSTQALVNNSMGTAFGNTATFGSFTINPTQFNTSVVGSGSTSGFGLSAVNVLPNGFNVVTSSSSSSTVCPVRKSDR